MSKIKKKWISNFIAIGFLIYLYSLLDISLFSNTFKEKGFSLIYVLLITLLTQYFRLIRNYSVLKSVNAIKISILRFIPHGMIGNAISTYGPFKSGEIGVIQLYNSQMDVKVEDSMATIILGRTLDIVIVLMLAISGISLIPLDQIKSLAILFSLVAFMVILIFAILLNERFGRFLIEFIGKRSSRAILFKLIGFLNNYYSSLKSLLKNKKSKLLLIFYTILRWISEIGAVLLLYHLLGVDLDLIQVLLIIGLSYAVGVASGSPGSLGSAQFTAYSLLVFVFEIPSSITVVLLAFGVVLGIIVNLFQISLGLIITSLFPIKSK